MDEATDPSGDVTVDTSPQFLELKDWLRGKDLHERMLPRHEVDYGQQARLEAFLKVVALFLSKHHGDYEDAGDDYLNKQMAAFDLLLVVTSKPE
jgi:hypothetical protein